MTIQDLRIGNLIKLGDDVTSVTGIIGELIYINRLNSKEILQNKDTITPIPLTEEFLIRFGFSARLDNLFYVNFFFTLAKSEEGFRLWIVSGTYGRTIHYVHELQNLYFALTGQELTLAPPQR